MGARRGTSPMSLVTRCPSCGTTFRVQSAQLALRGGKVRCGQCAAVFDGVGSLVEEVGGASTPDSEPSPQLALFEPSPPEGTAAVALDDLHRAEPDFLREAPPPRGRAAWLIASLAAVLAFGLQLALHYRTELAVLFPEARAPLEAACESLGCALRLPRRPDLMSIDSSDLESDNRHEGVIVLNAVINNRAPFAQEYPALELTLTDERDQAVARRVLAPGEYLPGAARAAAGAGIAAGAETSVRLHFDTGALPAVGYRLYLFYP